MQKTIPVRLKRIQKVEVDIFCLCRHLQASIYLKSYPGLIVSAAGRDSTWAIHVNTPFGLAADVVF